MVREEKKYDYLSAWGNEMAGITSYSTEEAAKESGGGDVYKTIRGKYVNDDSIKTLVRQTLDNTYSRIGKSALEANNQDYNAAFNELYENMKARAPKATGESISPKDEDSYTYGGSVLETKNFKYDYSQDTISSDQSGELTGIIRNAAKNSDFYKNPKGLSQEELDAILAESIAGVLPYTTPKDVDVATFVRKDATQNKPLTLKYKEDGKVKTITGLPMYLESPKGENKYEIRVAYISEKGTNGDPDIWETKLVPYEGSNKSRVDTEYSDIDKKTGKYTFPSFLEGVKKGVTQPSGQGGGAEKNEPGKTGKRTRWDSATKKMIEY